MRVLWLCVAAQVPAWALSPPPRTRWSNGRTYLSLRSSVLEDLNREKYCDHDDCSVEEAAAAEAERLMAEVARLRAELNVQATDLQAFKEETQDIKEKNEAPSHVADTTTYEQLEPRWTLRLNVGREENAEAGATHLLANLADREWGASGSRLLIDLDVLFDDAPLPPGTTAHSEVGPAEHTKLAKAATRTAKFISDCGQQVLSVGDGGWFISERAGKPRELNFWLQLEESVEKSDVLLESGRIVFTTSVWSDEELMSLRAELEEAKLQGQKVEKEVEENGENPMTLLKYNQALAKVQELSARLPAPGEGLKKGGWVGDESISLSMRGLLSITKKASGVFSLIFPTSQQCIGKYSATPRVGEHKHLETGDFSKYY